jgi:adenylate cyclase class IV
LIELYDIRQVRHFLLQQGFNEIISYDKTRQYFIREQYHVTLVPSMKKIDRLVVELICANIQFDFQEFDKWYRKAKKHKV